MAVVLQAATGNIGKLGGSSGGLIWNSLPAPACGRMDAAARTDNPSIPEYRWPDAVLEGRRGGYGVDIGCIYNVGGNYLSQGSDIKKNIRAFNRLDLSVCHDIFMTPTARYCDVVLPTTTFLEREDIIFPGVNYLFYSGRAMDPPGDVKNDYDIFCALAERLGYGEAYSEGKRASQWLAQFAAQSDIPDVAHFKQTGIYSGKEQIRMGLSDFIADPVQHPLKTPSGKIELASEAYAQTGYAAFPTFRGPADSEPYPLKMVTPHALHRVNSSYSNVQWFRDRESQVLWMNPLDAEQRNIRDGQAVSVVSAQGRVIIGAKVTADIMPGVVCLLQGVWPQLDGNDVDRAGATNMLTSTDPTLPSDGSRTHSIAVEVDSAPDLLPKAC